MEQIRILHFVSSLDIGSGMMSVIMNYYRNINRDNIQFDFLYFNKTSNTYEKEIKALGGNTYYVSRPSLKRIFSVYDEYNRFFKEKVNRYKAVHLHLVFLNTFILPLAKKYGIKNLITHSHNTKFSDKKLSAIRNRILCLPIKKQANIYFACSKAAATSLYGQRYVNSGKVKIINNAIDFEDFKYNETLRNNIRSELRISNNLVIGHVGRFNEQKNHAFLIDIFNAIKKQKEDVKLILVGDGPLLKQVKHKVNYLGLKEDVLFLGKRDDVPNLLQVMDIFVLPSLFEGLPVVGVEAQASGLPIVMSTNITREIGLSNYAYIKLNESAEYWAKHILSMNYINRNDTSDNFIESGFNIYEEAEKLEQRYLNMKY